MGIAAGIGGLVGGLSGLFGGGTDQPQGPPAFIMPNMGGAANNAYGMIGGMNQFTNPASGSLNQAGQTFSNLYNNPFAGGFQSGANFAGGMGQNAALGAYGAGGQLQGAGLSMIPGAQQIMNTAFDPQNALYNRTAQQNQDQVRAAEAARGIATTPYGAGLENQAMSNFNIDWQNNQLGRMATGAGAAGGLLNQAAGVTNVGTGIQNAAPGQFLQGSMMPYGAYGQIGGDQNQAIASYLSSIGGAANIYNMPIQNYLSYLGVGNQAGSVANQNYANQLQAQKQQFGEQMQLGQMLGGSLYGLNQSGFGGGGLFGGQGPVGSFFGGGGGGPASIQTLPGMGYGYPTFG